jgi:hypothetical protein
MVDGRRPRLIRFARLTADLDADRVSRRPGRRWKTHGDVDDAADLLLRRPLTRQQYDRRRHRYRAAHDAAGTGQ